MTLLSKFLAGRSLLLVGDSITEQLLHYLICDLIRHGFEIVDDTQDEQYRVRVVLCDCVVLRCIVLCGGFPVFCESLERVIKAQH